LQEVTNLTDGLGLRMETHQNATGKGKWTLGDAAITAYSHI
jgi:hypothetical protein